MKEIGAKLKEARENMGISAEEVSSDLNVTLKQIENIESGNMEAFKDIFYLKYFIRDYAKYLGLNKEDLVDSLTKIFKVFIPAESKGNNNIITINKAMTILEKLILLGNFIKTP